MNVRTGESGGFLLITVRKFHVIIYSVIKIVLCTNSTRRSNQTISTRGCDQGNRRVLFRNRRRVKGMELWVIQLGG